MERSQLIIRAIIGGIVGGIIGSVVAIFLGHILYLPLIILICAISTTFCTKASELPPESSI